MSLSGMVESPRQPDVIKKILQHLGKTVAVRFWLFGNFSSGPRGDDRVNGFRNGRAVSYS